MNENPVPDLTVPDLGEITAIVAPCLNPVPFQEAAALLEATRERLVACRGELATAEAALASTREAYRAHLDRVCDGAADRTAEAERAVQKSESRAALLAHKLALLNAAVAARQAEHRAAWVEAHRPLFNTGVHLRVAAARLADHARFLLGEAETQAKRGNEMIQQARRQGFGRGETDDPQLVSHALGPLKPEALEREIWERITP